MEQFKITKEMMLNAKTYMPLSIKEELSKQIAELCLVPMKTAESNRKGEQVLALPYLKVEELSIKYMLMQNTLLSFYFNVETDENEDEETTYDIYDYYASSNPLGQIERYKSDHELKDKAFDLLADYKDFKKMVDAQLFNLKLSANDNFARLTSAIAVFATPENLEKTADYLQNQIEDNQTLAIKNEGKIEN